MVAQDFKIAAGEAGASDVGARRVVLVDDHRTFVELLRYALGSAPGLRCVGAAHDLSTGLQMVATLRPDLVVMDYEFPGSNSDGIRATAAITAQYPDVRVVLLTGRADPALLQRAAAAGARSLLPKDGSLPDLLDALQSTGSSGMLVHPKLLRSVGAPTDDSPLSPREREVLAMLAIGMVAAEIAEQLGISKHTCRGYIKSLLWKLGAHNQLEAVALARRRGLVAGP